MFVPGIDGSDLNQLADDLDRLGIPMVAGFSTQHHWDHLLWHSRFGDVPRYATPAGAQAAGEARERAQGMAAESASGIPLELIGLFTPLPADGGPVPGEIVEHQAHAIGHAAVLLADRGVLLAADHANLDALRRGAEPVDARLGQDWLSGPHQSNLEQARHSSGWTSASSCSGLHERERRVHHEDEDDGHRERDRPGDRRQRGGPPQQQRQWVGELVPEIPEGMAAGDRRKPRAA